MQRMIRWAAAAAACGVVWAPAAANAATRLVDDDHKQCRSAAYTTIQAAVDDAKHGDTIAVCDGTYGDDVSVERDYDSPRTRDLTIKSRRSRKAVLAGNVRLCSFSGPVVVRDFTITGTVDAGCVGGSQAAVENNLFLGGSISMFNGYAMIRRNTLRGYTGVGIDVGGSNYGAGGSADIALNRLEGAPGSIGIHVFEGFPRCYLAFYAKVVGNTIVGGDTGILTDQCGSADFISNRVSGAVTGARIQDAYIVRHNVLRGNSGDGLVIENAWDSTGVTDNDARGNGGTDCVLLNGTKPAGWLRNRGLDASPAGLCTANGK